MRRRRRRRCFSSARAQARVDLDAVVHARARPARRARPAARRRCRRRPRRASSVAAVLEAHPRDRAVALERRDRRLRVQLDAVRRMQVREGARHLGPEHVLERRARRIHHRHVAAGRARGRGHLGADPAAADDHDARRPARSAPGSRPSRRRGAGAARRRGPRPAPAARAASRRSSGAGCRRRSARRRPARPRSRPDPDRRTSVEVRSSMSLLSVEALVVHVDLRPLGASGEVALGERRPHVGPLGLLADEDDRPVEALFAQRRRGRAPPARLAPTMTKVRPVGHVASERTRRPAIRLDRMNVLVVGSGGREHALVWKLAQSEEIGELHAAPGNPGIAGSRRAIRCGPTTPRRCSRSAASARSGWSSSAPRRRSSRAWPTSCARAACPCSARARRPRGSRGRRRSPRTCSRAAGVPAAAELDAPFAPCVIKADGLAAGKGVFVCRTQPEADDAWRARPGVRRRGRRRGAARGRGAVASSRSPTASRRSRCRPHATRSGCSTGTRARTPAAWARTRPSPAIDEDETAELVERIHKPVLARAGPARIALRRAALRGAHAHGRRPARARVQLPLRRSRDAGRAAAHRGRPAGAVRARRAGRPRRRRAGRGRTGRRHRRARLARLPRRARHRRADRGDRGRRGRRRARLPRGHRASRRRARERRRPRARRHRTSAQRSPRRATAPTRAPAASGSPTPTTAATSRQTHSMSQAETTPPHLPRRLRARCQSWTNSSRARWSRS